MCHGIGGRASFWTPRHPSPGHTAPVRARPSRAAAVREGLTSSNGYLDGFEPWLMRYACQNR